MKNWLVVTFIFLLVGCSSPQISDYQNTTPKLSLEDFFNGKLTAHGMVLDYNNKLTRRFTVAIDAHWQDNIGIIDERFTYNDGEIAFRKWQIERLPDGSYEGKANDIIGTAIGRTSGSMLYWNYHMEIMVDGEPMEVFLDDWMYLIDDRHLLNKSTIMKYGIEVGEVFLSIEKSL
ncbi:DUF3833 domain-containing protein [Alteromonadaceae bacterium BrNp21-10]|nr:DUF3833 domain-containing protein [Alteromonadaceae bacterium BrNp21-10]